LANQWNVPVFQPKSLKNPEAQKDLAQLAPDVLVVVSYGLILPREILSIPLLGCLNVHASLLPRWRGAAPIHWAILAGDTQTGVTIMQMDEGLDTGSIVYQEACNIDAQETTERLHDKLATQGAQALWSVLACQSWVSKPQSNEGSCYAAKISKEQAVLNWHESALDLSRKVRAFNPWPIAHTLMGQEILRIWQAEAIEGDVQMAVPGQIIAVTPQAIDVATGSGILRINQLQCAGGRRLPVSDFLNAKAARFSPGTLLGAINHF
jgi:methionyl-tRNA formyltransferase